MIKGEKTRQTGYDLLRILSAFAVVIIHVNASYYRNSMVRGVLSGDYIVETILNFLTRFSVPCFVMMSGAFGLNSDSASSPKDFYLKKLKKILVPYSFILFAWFIVYGIKNILFEQDFLSYLKMLIGFQPGALWFIPMLIGLYLLTPIMYVFISGVSDIFYRNVVIILILWAVISQCTTDAQVPYSISVVISYSAYYLLGGYIKHLELEAKQNSHNWMKGIGFFAAAIGMFLRVILGQRYPNRWVFPAYTNFFDPFVVVYSVSVFCSVTKINLKCNLKRISDLMFYVYLLHMPVLCVLQLLVSDRIIVCESFTIIVYSVIVFLCSIILAVIFDFFLKKLKLV